MSIVIVMHRKIRISLFIIVWLGMISLACNLTSSEPPPTLVPRGGSVDATPKATLGYATSLAPDLKDVTPFSTQTQIDLELFNLLEQVQSDRLIMHVDNLVSFHTRHVNSPMNRLDYGIGAAYNYIMEQLQAIQLNAPENFTVFPFEFTAEYDGKRTTQYNPVAYIKGTDVGAGVILVGAHYDSRTDNLTDAEGFAPGASDNASGVAAVLEMARIMSQRSHRTSLMFVLFSAEEVNAQGSRAFINDYLRNHDIALEAMINVDTIGNWNGPSGEVDSDHIRVFSRDPNNSQSRQLARMTEFIGVNHALPLTISMQNSIDREGRYGDHVPFDEAGYPSIRFIEAVEDTNMREGRDTIDGVEVAYLSDATKTILGVVTALADGIRPPDNIALRNTDDGLQRLVWEPIPGATRYVVGLRLPGSLKFNYFITPDDNPAAGPWDGWSDYEAVAIAALDSSGMVGPFSSELNVR